MDACRQAFVMVQKEIAMLTAPGQVAHSCDRTGPTTVSTSPGQKRHQPCPHSGSGLQPGAAIRNELLLAVPTDELMRLRPHLERVSLKRRQLLQERNVPLAYAWFIERGTASLMSRTGNGPDTLEIRSVGCKDVVGLPLILGTMRSPHRCLVQEPGEALRIRAEDFQRVLQERPVLQQLLLAYVQAAMVQSAQLVVCNACHTLRERLARRLLLAHDGLDRPEIAVTHQMLGRVLGVRRAGVTTAMGRMEQEGLLRRGRGHIVILDRAGLEETSCDCYRLIQAEYQRVGCGPRTTADDTRCPALRDSPRPEAYA
jgi:CRP-like cAMP-binding protein